MEIDKAYEGREHSVVKHALLKGYLEKLLFIMGMTGIREIAYVDCFSGPYQDEREDIQATSIAISLGILSKVREDLKIRGKYITMRAIYVEEKKSSYYRLKEYLDRHCPEGIQAFSIHGDYAENTDEILQRCGNNSFAFFFVDPLGWTDVGIPRLGKLLNRPNSEFLITFMYAHLNRFVNKPELREQVNEMLGTLSDEEYEKIQSSLLPKDREEFIVQKYREQIKEAMGMDGTRRSRTYSTIVKDKDRERTKYHLIYGTRHWKGIVEFATQSEKAELIQRVVRIQVKQNANPNFSLFPPEEEVEHFDDVRVDIDEVKNYWLKELNVRPVVFDEERLADMLEETGWLISDLEAAFMELQADGKVENLDTRRKRNKHPIDFKTGEQLRRLA
jgi:three-Cys-motif partner protein